MKIWISRYELTARVNLNARARSIVRRGALLCVGSGFADLHPWPELGDQDLDQQLSGLARGQRTPQVEASLELAAIDAAARERGVSLFEGLSIPESHWPGVAGPAPQGFDTVKLKCGPHTTASDLESAAAQGLRLRLDFNETLTLEQFERLAPFMTSPPVDFVEDPIAYESGSWIDLRRRFGVRLAIDRKFATDGVDVVVHKPALSTTLPAFDGEVVITSYMDHPVGQFGAAWFAARNQERVSARCGLFTHVIFESNVFAEAIQTNGSRLLPPNGTGIGFDDQLEKMTWMPLR